MNTKHLFFIMTTASLLFASCGGGNGKQNNRTESAADSSIVAAADSTAAADTATKAKSFDELADEPVLDIVTSYGIIKIKLYSKTPAHRDNFIKLAKSGFYNGILFHRVINGFMIQTGDPLTKDPEMADRYGTGGPGYQIPAEILPEYYHKKGALAAARKGDIANPYRESSGSQFYLVQDEIACSQLDGQYTVFGETLEGLDVIDKIASVQTDRRDRPVQDIKIITIKPAE